MKTRKSLCFFLIFFLASPFVNAEQLETYRNLREWKPYFTQELNKLYSDTRYEFSRINIGSRKIEWNTYTERLFYRMARATPFLEITHHDRDRTIDYSLKAGSLFNFENSYLTSDIGFGMDTDFLYRFQTSHEYQHKLYKTLYGKWQARYLHYEVADVFIASPAGLTYYWGNHYISADYNFSVSEGRNTAHWVTARANYVIHPALHVYAGTALGERLFDIFEIDATDQDGFILFAGVEIRLHDRIQVSAGYSYAEENPAFIKRSIDTSLSLKFG